VRFTLRQNNGRHANRATSERQGEIVTETERDCGLKTARERE